MKQLKIEVTRASNGYVRKEGRLFSSAESFENILPKKKGAEIETHKSGDMQATIKGKVVGYFWESEGVGYFFETPKEFSNFMKKAKNGEFEVKEKPEKQKKEKKAKKEEKVKGRQRRKPSDNSDSPEKDPDIDLDSVVDEDASPAANALEVLKVLKKEIKRLKVKSENVSDLIGVIEDYLKEAKKVKVEKESKGKKKVDKPAPRRGKGKKASSSSSDSKKSSSSGDPDSSDDTLGYSSDYPNSSDD